MARPQVEEGYIRIANELAEAFMRLKLSDQEWRVFWVIIRFSYGWNKKTAVLSLREFGQWTGIDVRHMSTVISKLVGKRVVLRNGKEYSIQKDYDLWLSPEHESHKHESHKQESHEQVKEFTRACEKKSHEQVNATPLAANNDAALETPKDSLKTSFKDISLRKRLLKEIKKIFPALSIPDSIPDEKLDFLVYKIGKGEIRAEGIKSPLAYLKALSICEHFPSLIDREAEAEKMRLEERERRKREREEERKAAGSREFHKQKAREAFDKLSGVKSCRSLTQ